MPGLLMTITDAGLDAIVDAQNGGTAMVLITAVGFTAQAFVQAPTITALPGEFKRIVGVSGESVSDSIVHISAYDTSTDVYDVRGFGLYDDVGTLIAVYSAAVNPVLSKAELAFALLSVDIAFSNDFGAQIAFGNAVFSYPPASKTVKGVLELSDDAQADAGDDDLTAMTPKMVDRVIRALLPAGFVGMWSGPFLAVPAGWLLCDGTNGTPDLRDKFVIGAGSTYAVGQTGGALTHDHVAAVEGHALTIAETPAHRHLTVIPGVSAGALDANSSIAGTRVAGGDSEYVLNGTAGEPTAGRTDAIGGGQAHDHSLTLDPANHLPPFYALAYIMKVW